MSRRLLFTLFAALLLLCAGLSGAARAAVTAVNLVERVAVVAVKGEAHLPADDQARTAPQPMADADGTVELADVPLLPGNTPSLPHFLGTHLPPRPALHAGHPAPCLDGLLRPPSRRA
jgi:hypothetical protein